MSDSLVWVCHLLLPVLLWWLFVSCILHLVVSTSLLSASEIKPCTLSKGQCTMPQSNHCTNMFKAAQQQVLDVNLAYKFPRETSQILRGFIWHFTGLKEFVANMFALAAKVGPIHSVFDVHYIKEQNYSMISWHNSGLLKHVNIENFLFLEWTSGLHCFIRYLHK